MKKNPTKKELKDFGIFIGLFFPFFIGLIIPLIFGHSLKFWTIYVSIPSLIMGLFVPNTLYYPYKYWMKLGHILGWINSYIILGIIFVLVLQPISFVMRLTGYDPLRTRKKNVITYREVRSEDKIDLNRIF